MSPKATASAAGDAELVGERGASADALVTPAALISTSPRIDQVGVGAVADGRVDPVAEVRPGRRRRGAPAA